MEKANYLKDKNFITWLRMVDATDCGGKWEPCDSPHFHDSSLREKPA